MKLFLTTFLLLFGLFAQAQSAIQDQFKIRGSAKVSGNLNRQYQQTTLDWNGTLLTIEGTAQNLASVTGNIVNVVGNTIGGLFGNNTSDDDVEVEQGDDWITYRYDDKVITERTKYVTRFLPQVGLEIAYVPENRYFDGFVSAFTGKYKIIGIDGSANIRVYGGRMIREVMNEFMDIPLWVDAADYLFIGYTKGFDTSYPGLLKTKQKGYRGFSTGAMYPIMDGNGEVNMTLQFDGKGRKDGQLKQSNISVGLKIPLNS